MTSRALSGSMTTHRKTTRRQAFCRQVIHRHGKSSTRLFIETIPRRRDTSSTGHFIDCLSVPTSHRQDKSSNEYISTLVDNTFIGHKSRCGRRHVRSKEYHHRRGFQWNRVALAVWLISCWLVFVFFFCSLTWAVGPQSTDRLKILCVIAPV